MNKIHSVSFMVIFFIGIVFFLVLKTTVAQAVGGPSLCISDPVSFGGLEKRLLPLASECKIASGYDYCGRGEQATGEYAPSPGCATPTSIVLHTTHGDLTTDDLYNYFADGSGNRHVGSHFGIGQDGKIIQMVEMGKSQVEYAQAVGGIKDHISIEMGAPGNYANKDEAPAAQYGSALKLVKTLMQTYNIPLSGVKGHFDYWPVSSGGAGDPGEGWMADFKKDLPDSPALDGGSSTNPGTGGSSTSSSCAITAVGNPDPATKPVCAVTDGGGGGGLSPDGSCKQPPDYPADLKLAIFNEFKITMNNFDADHLKWAYELFWCVSGTKFQSLVSLTEVNVVANVGDSRMSCPDGELGNCFINIGQMPGRPTSFKFLLTHEFGHVINYNNPRETIQWTAQENAFAQEGGISYYAKNATACTGSDNSAEDYADMIAYFLHPLAGETTPACDPNKTPPNPLYELTTFPLHFEVAKMILL